MIQVLTGAAISEGEFYQGLLIINKGRIEKMKRRLSMFLCIVMLTGAFAGCTPSSQQPSAGSSAVVSQGTGSSASAKPEAEESKLNTDKKITLDIMLTPQWRGIYDQTVKDADYPDFFNFVAGEFSKKYPNVSFNVQVITGTERSAILNANIQANTPPDIFFESIMPMTDYAHMGALVPLDDMITDEDRADIDKASMAEGNIAGQQFFYPFAKSMGLLIVNADYFKEAGLESLLPKDGELGRWTPEEFQNALGALKKNITKQGFSPFGFFCKNNQSDQYNNIYLRMFGAEMFNKDSSACVINSAEGVKAAEFLKKIYDLGYMEPGPETYQSADTRTMFRNQEIAVAYCLTAHYTEIMSDMESGVLSKFDTALFTLPGEDEPNSFSMGYATCVFDSGDEDRTAFAKEFVKFFSSDPEYTMASATLALPVRQSVVDKVTGKDYIPLMLSASPYCRDFTGGIPEYVAFRNLLYPTVQVVLNGSKSPQQALDDFARDATDLITTGRAESVLFS